MSKAYSHILSPVKIGNTVLKSRLLSANALPHFLQGPELYPADPIMFHLQNVAKAGAAVVTFGNWTNMNQRQGFGDGVHFPMFDTSDPSLENYMTQLTEAIHFYGSKATIAYMPAAPAGYGVCDADRPYMSMSDMPPMDDDDEPPFPMDGGPGGPDGPEEKAEQMPAGPFGMGPQKAITPELMEKFIEDTVKGLAYYVNCGFDGVSLHMAYQGPMLAQFLSPLCNHRTDEYGGSMENRARLPLALCAAIKKAYGQDFLVEVLMSGEEEGGITIEDTVTFAKLAEGKVDILQIRGGDGDLAHPTGFNSVRHAPITLRVAEAVKKSGAKILTCPIGGFEDPDDIEEYIASGKTDMVGAGRLFICEPNYAEKLIDGRGDDVVPCIRCNRCHGLSMQGPWLSVCSVNPTVGIAHKIERMVQPAKRVKKVAVVGGGVSGMVSAAELRKRGHQVVLFEKNAELGGQLLHADYSSFKWPLKDYKDFLVRQMGKLGVEVRLQTAPTAEELENEHFDSVVAAMGAAPKLPPVEGILVDGKQADNVWNPLQVYGHEQDLGKEVVVIGGGEIGVETAMYLAETGHTVTLLSRQAKLAADADRVHYYSMFAKAWSEMKNLTTVKRATTTAVTPEGVAYVDKKGQEQFIRCDSIVACGGMQPRHDEALALSCVSSEFVMVGDNVTTGNVQTCVRSAYARANGI